MTPHPHIVNCFYVLVNNNEIIKINIEEIKEITFVANVTAYIYESVVCSFINTTVLSHHVYISNLYFFQLSTPIESVECYQRNVVHYSMALLLCLLL